MKNYSITSSETLVRPDLEYSTMSEDNEYNQPGARSLKSEHFGNFPYFMIRLCQSKQ